MKTPDEIKKGLYVCPEELCHICPYEPDGDCMSDCMSNAHAYIIQLESCLAQVKRERDAAVKDIGISCDYCAYADYPFGEAPCMALEEYELGKLCSGWQWRGVCAENTKEQNQGEKQV